MLQENVQLPFLLLRNITIIRRLIRTPNSKIGKASLFCRTTGQIWVETERWQKGSQFVCTPNCNGVRFVSILFFIFCMKCFSQFKVEF